MPFTSPVAQLRGVIGYIRVSTEEQELLLQAQQQTLEGWCSAPEVVLLRAIIDAFAQ